MKTKCEFCGEVIPAGRVRAIPGVTTCVAHSTVTRRRDEDDGIVNGTASDELTRMVATPERESGNSMGRASR